MPVKKKRSSSKKTTKATGRKRNLRREYLMYHASPEQKKKRAARNKARRIMVKAGKAHKGDGKHVDHIKPLRSGGTSSRGNLRIRSAKSNMADAGGKGGRPKKNSRKARKRL